MSQRPKTPLSIVLTEPHRCSLDMRTRILGHMPIFRDLPEDLSRQLFSSFVHKGFQAGQTIYWEGDDGENLYVMAQGKAKLLQSGGGERSVLLDIMAGGDIFGNLSLDMQTRYTNSAQSLTRCCALAVSVETFKKTLDQSPQLALKTLQVLAERAQSSHKRLLSMGTMAVEQRIAHLLLTLSGKLGVKKEDYRLIDVPLSRSDLADMVGTTAESVSRVLSQLDSDGVITSGRQWVGIRDEQKLKEIL